jgi:undecaprenyl diphosphate synthase
MNHIALTGSFDQGDFVELSKLIKSQTEKDIPILTLDLSSFNGELLTQFLTFYVKQSYLDENQIKVSFIGKWYNLTNSLLDQVKSLSSDTKEYTNYFLNFVLNYDGHEEIVDAVKILCRQMINDKLDVESINKSLLKENLYTSYFVPPEVIYVVKKNKLGGFLLWDSYYSEIKFIESFEVI